MRKKGSFVKQVPSFIICFVSILKGKEFIFIVVDFASIDSAQVNLNIHLIKEVASKFQSYLIHNNIGQSDMNPTHT